MKEFIKYGEDKGADYVELKTTNTVNNVIDLQNKHVKEISISQMKYYSVRVLYKGAFGTAYSNEKEYKKLIDKAMKTASLVKKDLRLSNIPNIKKRIKTSYKKDLNSVSLDDKKNKLLELTKLMKEYPKVNSLRLAQSDIIKNYKLVNSHGAELEWDDSFIKFLAYAFSQEGNRQENYPEVKRGHYGYELMNEAEKITRKALEYSQKLLNAKLAKAGNFPVILDQKLGGVFTHEAIGHATEADAVINQETVLINKLNQVIASSNITVVDDGTLKTNGWVPFDDDGVKSQKNVLIKKGVLNKYLQSLETSSILGEKPTGNGRAQSIANLVIPRMTTTYIAKGNSSFEEIIKTIKDGYYLLGSMGGQVDSSKGEFLFNAKHGYHIVNGEVKELVKGVSLTGNILNIMPKISLVAKDLEFGNGICGKCSQNVPVSEGAPHFKIDMARVGGQ